MKTKLLDAPYISAFCMEMYLIIRAGIPFDEGVALLCDDEVEQRRHVLLERFYQQ